MDDWRKYFEMAMQFDPRDFLAFAQRGPSSTNFGPMPEHDILRLQAKNPYEAEQLMRKYDEMGVPVRASAPVPQGWDTSKLPVPQGSPGIDQMLFALAQQQQARNPDPAFARQVQSTAVPMPAPPGEQEAGPWPMVPEVDRTAGDDYLRSMIIAGMPINSETAAMAGNPIMPGEQAGIPSPGFSSEAMKQMAGMVPKAPEPHYAPYAPSGPGPSQVRLSQPILEAILALQKEREKTDLVPTMAALLAGRM